MAASIPRIWTPSLVLIHPIYTASTESGYVSPPSSIGGTNDLGTAPGKVIWSHCCFSYVTAEAKRDSLWTAL